MEIYTEGKGGVTIVNNTSALFSMYWIFIISILKAVNWFLSLLRGEMQS